MRATRNTTTLVPTANTASRRRPAKLRKAPVSHLKPEDLAWGAALRCDRKISTPEAITKISSMIATRAVAIRGKMFSIVVRVVPHYSTPAALQEETARRSPAAQRRPNAYALIGRFLQADLREQAVHHLDHFTVDGPVLGNRFFQRDGNNFVRAQRRHAPKLPTMRHVNGAQPITRRQHAVERTRRTAALNVSQHHRAGLKRSALFDFPRQEVRNPAQLGVAK